jgi:hypothetical protein
MQVLTTAPLSPQVRHGLEPEFIGSVCMQVLTTAPLSPQVRHGLEPEFIGSVCMQVLTTTPISPQVRHGLEPEFIGRIPVRVACQRLREADLFRVRACMQVLTTARHVPTAARGRSVSGAHRRARECQHASAHYGAPLSHRCSPTRTTRWRRRSCEISKGAREISSAPD